jgi:VIT1/CCC1 family predicted Fe2+/Mn2+ transporter
MPKLSEGILGAMKLMLSIRGKDQVDEFEGRIVGFSSRLNTILVPEKFMLWANEKYAEKKAAEPTRLILQVNNPADERITSYLQENNYVTDEDKLDASKTTFILRIIVGIVMAIGLIISILSFYILMLSIYLLVEKNNTKLENLLLLGYSPSKVSRPYQWLTVGLNIFVLVLALALLYVVRSIYLHQFQSFFPDFEAPSMWPAFIIGIALLLLVSIFNLIAIKRKVMSIWNKKE